MRIPLEINPRKTVHQTISMLAGRGHLFPIFPDFKDFYHKAVNVYFSQ